MRGLLSLVILSLLCNILSAKEYKVEEIPLVHLQDRTRYVCNPDGILSAATVATIDSVLFALEEKTGIQTIVAVVTGIEGGDCFQFAHTLGEKAGVGQKGRDNGLVVLLSTEERCIQFVTGYGLEGTLPDALCKRIQQRYMVEHFADDKWDEGMVAGIRALSGCLDGSMENINEDDEDETALILFLVIIFVGGMGLIIYAVWMMNRCPKCKKKGLVRLNSHVLSRSNGYIITETEYRCTNCGHMFKRKSSEADPNYRGPRGGSIIGGMGRGGSSGSFSGGSFGGGHFGGGGAGSRF